MSLKFGILKESTTHQDRRAPFSPKRLQELAALYPQAQFKVEASAHRIFSDEEYRHSTIEVATAITDCDVFIGINPIPEADRIATKAYVLVSDLVNEVPPVFTLDSIVGCIGAYNAFRAFGQKFDLFKLPQVSTFLDQAAMISYLKRPVLPPLKIMVVGNADSVSGVEVIMKAMKIKAVDDNDFLSKKYAQAVYTVIDTVDSDSLAPYTQVSDICIADSLLDSKPVVLSQEVLKAKDCQLRVLVDLRPNSANRISCTLRQSTSEEPFYGYLPADHKEVDVYHPAALVVVAVPDVATEFPRETSEFIGNQLAQHCIPAFYNTVHQTVL